MAQEQSATKTTNNVGEGPSRGLTTTRATHDVMRFSSDERRSPRRGVSDLVSPCEASYSARQEIRFFSDKPAKRRARSLTPDSGIKSLYGCNMIGRSSCAAGVASNSSQRWDSPGGLSDVGTRRVHGCTKAAEYRNRYSQNISGTSLAGTSSTPQPPPTPISPSQAADRPAGDSGMTSPRCDAGVDSSQHRGRGHSPTGKAPLTSTSKAVRESMRFFLAADGAKGASTRRELGVRTERPRTVISSNGAEVSHEKGPAPTPTMSSPRSPRSPRSQIVPQTLLEPVLESKNRTTPAPGVGKNSPTSSRCSSQRSLNRRSLGAELGSSKSPGLQGSSSCVPERREAAPAAVSSVRRLGNRSSNSGYVAGSLRDHRGRDLFESSLRA